MSTNGIIMQRKYTKELLQPIVQKSTSIRQVLIALNLNETGGNYSHISKTIDKLQIDRSHFKSKGWRKGKTFKKKYPIEDYLSNKRKTHSNSLKNRLIKEGYFEHKCYKCLRTEWEGNIIPIELHHIDCNHSNNNLSNLTILCPNCHTICHNKPKNTLIKTKLVKTIKLHQKRFISNIKSKHKTDGRAKPRPDSRKVQRPDYDTLKREIYKTSYSAVGRKYGVSDNAVRKWIKIYEKYS